MNGCRSTLCVANLVAGLLTLGLLPGPAPGQGQAESLSASFRKAAERVAPAVVAIRPLEPRVPSGPGTDRTDPARRDRPLAFPSGLATSIASQWDLAS